MTMEIPQADVLRSVVSGVILVPTLEVLVVAVVWVRESTVRATPQRVLVVNLLDLNAVSFGFVLDVLAQAVERPFVAP